MLRLTDLKPRWLGVKGSHSHIGLSFICPCCIGTDRETRLAVYYNTNVVLDSGGTIHLTDKTWELKSFPDFNCLTLMPSIDASEHKHWHGFITNGLIR